MPKLPANLIIIGVVSLVIGLLGLLSKLLVLMGVNFEFRVTPWYGPLIGGLVLIAIGWIMRLKQNTKPISNSGQE